MEKEGKIKKIASRVYTSNVKDKPEEMHKMQQILERSNAFLEPAEGKLKIV